MLQTKPLFNPLGDDSAFSKRVVNGNPSNLTNYENVKYHWALNLYDKMYNSHWIPDKIPMGEDKLSYKTLNTVEKNCYDKIISYLVFLDSVQCLSLPYFLPFISASEIVDCLNMQTNQELNHKKSYKYIIDSVIDTDNRSLIYDYWKECPELEARNSVVANAFQEFRDNPNLDTMANAVIHTYLLEGLFFWVGFNFFYLLESKHKMINTANQIRYIQKDEMMHCVIFENLIRTLNSEGNVVFSEDKVHALFDSAVKEEIKWNIYLFDDQILGFNQNSIDIYVKNLANRRLKKIGYSPLYLDDKYLVNPFKHLEDRGYTEQEGIEKSNYFEKTVTEYVQSSIFSSSQWDDV